jgi:hypothetical protein
MPYSYVCNNCRNLVSITVDQTHCPNCGIPITLPCNPVARQDNSLIAKNFHPTEGTSLLSGVPGTARGACNRYFGNNPWQSVHVNFQNEIEAARAQRRLSAYGTF